MSDLARTPMPAQAKSTWGAKPADDRRVSSVRHYPVVRTSNRVVIQHSRASDGVILTRIAGDGEILPDPPGISLPRLFT